MSEIKITDEQLVEYVDGNANDSLIREIEAALLNSDSLQQKIDAIKKTNIILNEISSEVKSESLPLDIQNLIEAQQQKERQSSDKNEQSMIKNILISFSSFGLNRFAMVATSIFLGAYIGLNYEGDQVINANKIPGEYSIVTLRGEDNSLDEVISQIVSERRLNSTIQVSGSVYQVLLKNSFTDGVGQSCDLGEIINPDAESVFFVACMALVENGSKTIITYTE